MYSNRLLIPQPKLVWNFRLPRVVSINASGHKYGLSYVGVGWVVWRDKGHLPKDLIFELHYLGSIEYSFSLNFSRPAAPIIAQYFNFLHLGFQGYRRVALTDLRNARLLARALERSGYYFVLSDVHRFSDGGSSVIEGAKKAAGVKDEEDVEVSSVASKCICKILKKGDTELRSEPSCCCLSLLRSIQGEISEHPAEVDANSLA